MHRRIVCFTMMVHNRVDVNYSASISIGAVVSTSILQNKGRIVFLALSAPIHQVLMFIAGREEAERLEGG
jgi:hypothetical protein